MIVAPSEKVICYDCDDTLIFWDENYQKPFEGAVKIRCPHDGDSTFHRVHHRHVRFLMKQKARGYTIVVWSSAGTAWAKAVVEALDLENHVDFVMSKPQKWVDNLIDPAEVLGKHIYLPEDGHSV